MTQVLGQLKTTMGFWRGRGVNPTSSMCCSQDNNNGVCFKADALCSSNVRVNIIATEAVSTTEQHLHLCDNETLNMSNIQDKGNGEQVTDRSTQLGPTVRRTLLMPATTYGRDMLDGSKHCRPNIKGHPILHCLVRNCTYCDPIVHSHLECRTWVIHAMLSNQRTPNKYPHNQYNINVAVATWTTDFILYWAC